MTASSPVPPNSALARRAAELGVAVGYVDGTGAERHPPASTVEAIVDLLHGSSAEKMGPPASDLLHGSSAEKMGPPASDQLHGSSAEEMGRCADGPQPTRTWGVFAPLAGLRSHGETGLGDVRTLRDLAAAVTPLGARVVGTLPLLAARPDEASPYSPLTRRFWDERWIDVEGLAGTLELAAPAPRRDRPDRPDRPDPSVPAEIERSADPSGAWSERRAALRELFERVERLPADALAWRSANPAVEVWARWKAAALRHGWDPARWPTGLGDAVRSAPAALASFGVTSADVGFEAFAQWAVSYQLRTLGADLRSRDTALYLDLPVGTSASGFDVWESPGDFAVGMSIGAPPDRFFPGGQSWGLVPPRPGRGDLERCLDLHMAVCGLLRIDHVMGLHRLFWVPDGCSAADGTYVAYPAGDQWRAVAAASRRHGCGVVGEDLGTVPDEVRAAMADVGARGLFVGQDETRAPFRLARPAPASVVASLNTHDLPTLAAWAAEHQPTADPGTVRDHLLAELAASDADIVLVSEQDLSLDPRRLNVPGEVGGDTWRLLARTAVGDIGGGEPARVLGDIEAWRSAPSGGSPAGSRPLLDDGDIASLHAGTHARLADRFGLHPRVVSGMVGAWASVWAPHAWEVAVAGDFDGWRGRHLRRRGDTGVWEGFLPAAVLGDRYKLHIRASDGSWTHKSDPFSRAGELPPDNASIITADDPAEGRWSDESWMADRAEHHRAGEPMSVYEVHLGSWRRHPDGRIPTYAEVAPWLVDYCADMGFTHVELMPVMEHPFGGSWGYHVSGYFAPTSRYGTPAEFAEMVDTLHRGGIGVILDWVPAHFPDDEHGLADFDGGALFEYGDPREGRHPEWGSRVFDWGRPEVRAFLVSSARWWLEQYHVDGLRVDAVASMLYRDYGREAGEWIPNVHGGRENLEAVDFVRQLTSEIHRSVPGALVIAEESTAWPGVTHPTEGGGLGFDLKWDLGWMHDTLTYLGRDAVHRRWHQDDLTFRAMYAHSERFVLPLSHDEVVHGKGSLVGKMAGDDWQRRANLRLLFGHQHTVPGVPLLFMGGELAMNEEWDHDTELPWYLLDHHPHRGVQRWVAELNGLRRRVTALAGDHFEWVDCDDRDNCVLAWVRGRGDDRVVVVANHTPTPLERYRIGVPGGAAWRVVANSDDERWGGSGAALPGAVLSDAVLSDDVPMKQWKRSIELTLPPLGLLILEAEP